MTRPGSWHRPALLAAAATFLVFLPSLFGDFLDWDDISNLVDNPYYRGLSRASLRWIFGFHFVHYYPLTWLSFSLDHALWGLDPFGFHLSNVLLHAANAALFTLILLELLPGRKMAAFLGALLFSLHPLRVESVAWITERSDLLSAFFYLLTVLLYLRRRLRAAQAAYLLSLAAKASGITLPLTLLVLDAYRSRRFALKEKLPFLGLATLAGTVNLYAQSKISAPYTLDALGLWPRLALAFHSFAFYMVKTLLPLHLLPLYPMPKPFLPMTTSYLLAAAAVASASAGLWWARRRQPALLAAWAHYLIALLPVCGLLQGGPQLVADRYSYLACLGWAAVAGAAMDKGRRRLIAFLLSAVLAVMTWTQCSVWHDATTFWSYQVRMDPRHAIARNYLGDRKARQGETAEGELLLRQALALDADYGAAHNNLANLLANQGRLPEALEHYGAALKASPQQPIVRHNLALALLRLGRRAEAVALLEDELRLSPHAEPTLALLRRLKD